ncbi:MAG TPA: diguanylate cyclase [Burkholderiaceae bacterium]|nr:diguanylate cyclase [Burkholderiaceae bacterium]
MNASIPLPALGQALMRDSAELLHAGERTRVWRVRQSADGPTLVCKQPTGPDAARRCRHEQAMLRRLAGVPGVVQLAGPAAADVLLLQDGGSASLALWQSRPMPVARLVPLALRLARVLAGVHRAGVIHKDICPANILLPAEGGEPLLIDFDLATAFAEERPAFVHHLEIAGTLAYLAPEQTGRTGRAVDQRADLYALGATLYELATGRPPFVQADALQLVHDHLARLPEPLRVHAPQVPPALSDIVLRLLEKEPDRRYQSAEGLAHDLAHLVERLAAGEEAPFTLGERDFPARLAAPSQLVGRQAELAELEAAFEDALVSRRRCVFVSGAPGVGKTALINELKPQVTARHGWFVYGKFDQYRQDGASGAVLTAMSALGRLLLAEPEDALARHRMRIERALGPQQVAAVTAVLPEFAHLLGNRPEPEPLPPAEAAVRTRMAGLALLRALCGPERPLVMVLDDLQWAAPSSIVFIDALLNDDEIRGLLLVGAWRSAEVDVAHPMSALLSRCTQSQPPPRRLELRNLPPGDVALLLQQMLRLPLPAAVELRDLVLPHTGGNPFDSIELVNALRHAGVLRHGEPGLQAGGPPARQSPWQWDAAAIRRWVGLGNVVDLLARRIASLPAPAQAVVEELACLGGDVTLALLGTATGLDPSTLALALAPALEDGLLVMDRGSRAAAGAPEGGDTVRLRHDRVQQAAYGSLPEARRQALHLAGARRLAAQARRAAVARDNPAQAAAARSLAREAAALAAEQYFAAASAITAPTEQAEAAQLFADAAAQAHRGSLYGTEERLLRAALLLLAAATGQAEAQLRTRLQVEHHAALYVLGRLPDADQAYATFAAVPQPPLLLAQAAGIQVKSLSDRGCQTEAVALGLQVLEQLGLARHEPAGAAATEHRLAALYRFAGQAELARDLAGEPPDDALMHTAARLINRMMAPAYYAAHDTLAWLLFESLRLWEENGPCAPLVATLASAPLLTIALRQDHATGYRIARHALAVGEARGWEPDASWARHCFSIFAQHWFEPLEACIPQARRAREGLLRGGDLQFACFTHYTVLSALLDSAESLDDCEAELAAGQAFALRAGNRNAAASFAAYGQLLQCLRGTDPSDAPDAPAGFDEAAHLHGVAANPIAEARYRVHRALGAALMDDLPALDLHSAAAFPVLAAIDGQYASALAHLLRALALAQRLHGGDPDGTLHEEFVARRDWLARRAAEAPGNFGHLLHLVDAERAWAASDLPLALQHFDQALREVEGAARPWHAAFIAERAGNCHLAQGLQVSGRSLLRDARQRYAAWGAHGKLRQFDARHPAVRHGAVEGASRAGAVSSSALDLVALLRASQALSSQTSLERLLQEVSDLLRELTGATRVGVAQWCEAGAAWRVNTRDGEPPWLFPAAPLHYVERTREPLLIDDALRDERFAHEPYFAALAHGSLLVLPIVCQGQLRALLVLENRLARAAFSAHRLDAVKLIAGQLAVSLDNALLYASLERKVADRTEALAAANRRLETLSVTDALTGVANRRRFDEVLESEWARTLRNHASMALAMVDIDHFKLYNDRHGHPAGDACLLRVANALSGAIRADVDLLARYGGEEFALILPGADLAVARAVAQRACAVVAALQLRHDAAPGGLLSISVGVAATSVTPRLSAAQLLQCADEALYRAKQGGRNRVES